MSKKFSSICFFLDTGRTFTFRDIQIVRDNETDITILYKSMTDNQAKEATFYKARIVGVARMG